MTWHNVVCASVLPLAGRRWRFSSLSEKKIKNTKEIRSRHAIENEMNAQRHCCPKVDVVAHETAEQLRRKQQAENIHNKRQTAAVTL